MRIAYENWKPGADALALVRVADSICAQYAEQGYDLTLRQLYYQFVARDLIPNNQRSYKRLGSVVDRARLAGLLDWDYIVDRTRNLRSVSHWDTPGDVIEGAARSYRIDKWATQPLRVEVWVEKEALAGIVQRAANAHDCAWFSCRGYVSQSEMWAAAQRHRRYIEAGQRVVILHLGDHDPSGIDMTRDIRDRLTNFTHRDWWRANPEATAEDDAVTYRRLAELMTGIEGLSGDPLTVERIALNYDQIEQYDPPPNPAKITDSRARSYIHRYGTESWELDALDPDVLNNLIADNITALWDEDAYDALRERERDERASLRSISANYEAIAEEYGS